MTTDDHVMADPEDAGRRAPSAQVVAATALGRASWCRRDGAHLFGVRMILGPDREQDLRAGDAEYRVSAWFGQDDNEQVPFGVRFFDASFVRVLTADRPTAAWRRLDTDDGPAVECHAAFVIFDVVAARPLRSLVFGELPFRVVAPEEAPAWLHHHHHVFATRPHFLESPSSAFVPEPGELPQGGGLRWAWSGVRLGEPVDVHRQRLAQVSSRADVVEFAELLAGDQKRDAAQRLRRLAAALDRPADLGIDVEAPAVSWQQLAAVLLQAFGRT